MTTDKVLTLIFAALTFEAVLISTIVAIVVAITKKEIATLHDQHR